jgi:hypothetical protein
MNPIVAIVSWLIAFGLTYFILKVKGKLNLFTRVILSFCSSGLLVVMLLLGNNLLSDSNKTGPLFNEFKSITLQWGPGDTLLNEYNSMTGEYRFVDVHNKLVKINVHLPREVLLYLHHQAVDLGFWQWPTKLIGDTSERFNGQRPLRYIMQFNYRGIGKKVVFDESFLKDQKLKDNAEQLVTDIQKVLDAEASAQK